MMSSNDAFTPRRLNWAEVFRILVLVLAAIAITSPFLTALRIGGVDALWYANMVRGVTDQIASGHFPIPMGQGAFAWNGGVHPFRSAPVFPLIAALWDVLSRGRLGPFSLQHLTVLTSAVLGTVGFYIGAAKIIPARRWAAAGFAFLYLAAPSWLAIVTDTEDYMSYMAFAAMPLVLYGNARSVMEDGGRGYVPLGVGVAVVWMCHPPIAFITSVATLFIQAGASISRGFAAWRGMVMCVVVFAVLGAYYFVSMSELTLTQEGGGQLRREMVTMIALALFFIGLGRCLLSPRNPAWAACALVAALIVGEASRPWLVWMLASTFFWFASWALARWSTRFDVGRNAFATMFACGLLGAATAEEIIGPNYTGAFKEPLKILSINTAAFGAFLRPISEPLRSVGVFQLGWGLDLALAAGALSLFGKRPLAAKVFFAASLGLGVCFVRVPLLSDFLISYSPIDLTAMSGVPLDLRIMPVIASFSAMAGVLWIATLPAPSRWSVPVLAALAILVGWSGFQAARFVRAGHLLTYSAARTENSVRAENVALARYAYDLMRLPFYYTNGVADPRMETRLLDDSGNILVGPEQTDRLLEARGVRRIRLVCGRFVSSSWIDVAPGITVEPGEHVLLRFEFDPARSYNGYMMMVSEHGYREYRLPDSGGVKSFGIGGARTTVLSLWNSGEQAEHYHIELMQESGNDLKIDGGLFANLSISEFEPKAIPIRLESLIPYRASVSTATGGWLETFVLYLPGYRAWVDGKPAAVVKSGESLAEVLVPPGDHTVEVRFVGTSRLWVAALASLAGWLTLAVLSTLKWRRGRARLA